jgi:quercetin dioxygenase-like cupin family protein
VTLPQSPDELEAALIEALLRGVAPAELSAQRRITLRTRVLRQARETPPAGTFTLRSLEGGWKEWLPCVQVKVLRIDADAGNQSVLLRMQPGGIIPAHRHAQPEEFIVLEGECDVGTHRLRAGDSHMANAGSWHGAVTTRVGVLVYLRGEYPPAAAPAQRPGR